MKLSDLYIDYLRTRGAAPAEALAAALRGQQPLEARLLSHYSAHGIGKLTMAEGAWEGREAWIGPRLPASPEAGQLWFDTTELTAMVLIPREPPGDDWHPDAIQRWTPFLGWLSLRPVAVWQYRAYLELAEIEPTEIESIHFKTFDPARILVEADETLPVTRLICAEARSFAGWMGKQLPAQDTWQAARRLLPGAIDVLWSGLKKEWTGYPEQEDDEAIAISPRTIDCDSREERDLDEAPPPERRMIYRHYDRSKSFGFRTAVFPEIGLLTGRSSSPRYER